MNQIRRLPIEITAPLVTTLFGVAMVLTFGEGCGLLVAPLTVAAVGHSLLRVWARRRRELSVVAAAPSGAIGSDPGRVTVVATLLMDGARCFKISDGSVVIRRRTVHTVLAIVALGSILLGLATGAGFALATGRAPIGGEALNLQSLLVLLSLLITMILVVGIPLVSLGRALRIPDVRLDADAAVLRIGRGGSIEPIPFSRIVRVFVEPSRRGFSLGIGVVLDDERLLPLGMVSDDGDAMQRAATIACWVAEATHTADVWILDGKGEQ